MAGLIAVSFAEGHNERGGAIFERACRAYASLKGLPRNAVSSGPGFRVARFASPRSACAAIHMGPEGTLAAAGWWFDPDAPVGESSLARLAEDPDRGRALERLQGQYLLTWAVTDGPRHRLLAVIDRLGMFPTYVAAGDGLALVSTSATALAAALGAPLDPQALWALFMGDAVRSPRSAFEGIRRLGMGEQAILEDGVLRIERVWTPYLEERRFRRIEDAADEGIALVDRTCAEVRRLWPRWVADLTSGLDSRLLVAGMSRVPADEPVHTTVNGPPEHVDVRISREISEAFGWRLHNHRVPDDWGAQRWRCFRLGVALADGELAGWVMDRTVDAKLALKAAFDCSVSGGAGEMLRDFFWTHEMLAIGRTKLDIKRLLKYRFFFNPVPELGLFEASWQSAFQAEQELRIRALAALSPDAPNTGKLDAIYLWKNSGHFGRFQGALHPLIVSVMPLSVPRLVELGLSVPWRFRMHSLLIRHMIDRLSHRLAAMPTCYGGSAQPFSLRRPQDLASYGTSLAQKLIRKLGQVTLHHPILPDSTARPQNPRWETDFISVLNNEGFLDIDRLRTAPLYRADGLRSFLTGYAEGAPRHLPQLHALVSAEWLARIVADPRLQETVRSGATA